MATRETAASPRLELASGGPTSASDHWRPASQRLPERGCAEVTLGSRGGKAPPRPIPATATSTWRPPASRRSQATRRSAQSTNSFIALATDPPPPLQPGRRALWVRTTGGRKEEAAANPPLSEANDGYQRRQVREVSNRGCAGIEFFPVWRQGILSRPGIARSDLRFQPEFFSGRFQCWLPQLGHRQISRSPPAGGICVARSIGTRTNAVAATTSVAALRHECRVPPSSRASAFSAAKTSSSLGIIKPHRAEGLPNQFWARSIDLPQRFGPKRKFSVYHW